MAVEVSTRDDRRVHEHGTTIQVVDGHLHVTADSVTNVIAIYAPEQWRRAEIKDSK